MEVKKYPDIFIICSEALTMKDRLLNIYSKATCDVPLKLQAARNISKSSCCQLQQSDMMSLQGTASKVIGMVTLKNKEF